MPSEGLSLRRYVEASAALGNRLDELVDGLDLKATPRNRASGACLRICIEHHLGITSLLDVGYPASGAALLRSQAESLIRGLWLQFAASDAEIDSFVAGEEPKTRLRGMIEGIEAALDITSLSELHKLSWSGLCDFTHTGGLFVSKFLQDEAIEPDFSPEELANYLSASAAWAATAAATIAGMGERIDIAQAIFRASDAMPAVPTL